jgi:hypothetical protein
LLVQLFPINTHKIELYPNQRLFGLSKGFHKNQSCVIDDALKMTVYSALEDEGKMGRGLEPVEYDEPEVVLSDASRLRRRFFFFSGIIVAFIGLVLVVVYFLFPSLGFLLATRMAMLGMSLFTTGAALAFGSLLVSPFGRGLGFFIVRFRPTAAGFLGCAIAACLSWSFFFLFLDNLERGVAGIVAGLTMVLVFRIYKRNTRESFDSLQKDEGETSETPLPTDSSSS